MPSNHYSKTNAQRTLPLTKHTVLGISEREYCTITIWFISNMYLWDTHSHSHTSHETNLRWIKPLVNSPMPKKERLSSQHCKIYVDPFYCAVDTFLAVFCLLLCSMSLCRCIWHWLLSSISLSSLTLTRSLCDIVKLHANTSSNKVPLVFFLSFVVVVVAFIGRVQHFPTIFPFEFSVPIPLLYCYDCALTYLYIFISIYSSYIWF